MLASVCGCETLTKHSKSWAGCVNFTWRARNLRQSCLFFTRPWPSSSVWSSKSEVRLCCSRRTSLGLGRVVQVFCVSLFCSGLSRLDKAVCEWGSRQQAWVFCKLFARLLAELCPGAVLVSFSSRAMLCAPRPWWKYHWMSCFNSCCFVFAI